jgi:hypothetical protein
MSTFRTLRPLIVDATQCNGEGKIFTGADGRVASKGDWIIKGENGETYVVDNAFFQRTFTSFPNFTPTEEGRSYGC